MDMNKNIQPPIPTPYHPGPPEVLAPEPEPIQIPLPVPMLETPVAPPPPAPMIMHHYHYHFFYHCYIPVQQGCYTPPQQEQC